MAFFLKHHRPPEFTIHLAGRHPPDFLRTDPAARKAVLLPEPKKPKPAHLRAV